MAEGDSEGLDLLLQQRQQRQTLPRMISWEAPADLSSPKSQRRQRKKQQKAQDKPPSDTLELPAEQCAAKDPASQSSAGNEASDSDSDLSQYVSAEEYQSEDEDSKGNNSSPGQLRSSLGNDELLDLWALNLDSPDKRGFWEEEPMQESCVDGERQRALSKRQKKRRREQRKLYQSENLSIPFRDADCFGFDLNDLTDLASMTSRREIPTLLQLCLQVMHSHRASSKIVGGRFRPGGVRRAMGVWQDVKKFSELQMNHLLRLLENVEASWRNIECVNFGYRFNREKFAFTDLQLPSRSIWCSSYDNVLKRPLHLTGEICPILLCPHLLFQDHRYSVNNAVTLISVLAAAVAMMLPQAVSEGRLRGFKGENVPLEERLSSSIEAILLHCRHTLAQRFPEVVRVLWDFAEPYVYWSRGNIVQAVEHFLALASNTAFAHKYQAMFLTEAARASWWSGNTTWASRLLRQAGDVMQESLTPGTLPFLRSQSQTLILLAGLQDMGVQSPETGRAALGLWTMVLQQLAAERTKTILAALDSMLCFHSGAFSGADWRKHLDSMIALLTSLKESEMGVLAFLCALKGTKSATDVHYQYFRNSAGFRVLPGGLDPLLDAVAESSLPEPLSVLWRTQLGHRSLEHTCHSEEADLCSPNLYLELTAEGKLTANLQMVLPPIRALNLDPYTGEHVFHQTPGITQPWQRFYEDDSCATGKFIVPTQSLLYRDMSEGVVVSLLTTGNIGTPGSNNEVTSMSLMWEQTCGRRAHLNLFQLVKEAFRKSTERIIQERNAVYNRAYGGHEGSKDWQERALLALDYCFKHNLSFQIHDLNAAIKFRKRTEKASQKSDKEVRKNIKMSRTSIPPFSILLDDHCAFGHGIYLLTSTAIDHQCCSVFVDCSSREAFLSPRLSCDFKIRSDVTDRDRIFGHPTGPKHQRPQELLCRTMQGEKQMVGVFNVKGELVMEIPHKGVVLGGTVYAVDMPSTVTATTATEPPRSGASLPGVVEDKESALHRLGTKLLAVTNAGLFIIHPQTLDPVPIDVISTSCHVTLSPDRLCIEGSYTNVVVLVEKVITSHLDGVPLMWVAVAADQHLLVFQLDELDYRGVKPGEEPVNSTRCELMMSLFLPGFIKEVYLGERPVGLLVTFSLCEIYSDNYREHLLRFSYSNSKLTHVLPMLGPGPRCFFSVLLPGNMDNCSVESSGKKEGWYLYMRDGHGGLIALRFEP